MPFLLHGGGVYLRGHRLDLAALIKGIWTGRFFFLTSFAFSFLFVLNLCVVWVGVCPGMLCFEREVLFSAREQIRTSE